MHKKIIERNYDEGVVHDKPYFFNRHGIGKAYFTDKCFLSDVDGCILEEDYWTTSFESYGPGPSLLKQNGNLFSVPATYTNSCFEDPWCVYVEVDVGIPVLSYDFMEPFYEDEKEIVSIGILQNGNIVSQSIGATTDFPRIKTIRHHDIVKCFPGDSLNIVVFQESEDGESLVNFVGDFEEEEDYLAELARGSTATFKIVGYQTQLLD